jgi:dihydropteroate synthase
MQAAPVYRSLLSEVLAYFEERIEEVIRAGVDREKIILDPGIGFGKTLGHNLSVLKHLPEFYVLGRPILIGTSRKSFIGSILNRDVEQRLWGSVATAVVGYWNGAHILRVHDVAETKEALTVAAAIQGVNYMT